MKQYAACGVSMKSSQQTCQKFWIFSPFPPHRVPRDPQKGSPQPPKTYFFLTERYLVCKVSVRSSQQAHQYLLIFCQYDLTGSRGTPRQGSPQPPKTRVYPNEAICGMWGVYEIVSTNLSKFLNYFVILTSLGPQGPQKKESPQPPKTNFFLVKRYAACGVSMKSS